MWDYKASQLNNHLWGYISSYLGNHLWGYTASYLKKKLVLIQFPLHFVFGRSAAYNISQTQHDQKTHTFPNVCQKMAEYVCVY